MRVPDSASPRCRWRTQWLPAALLLLPLLPLLLQQAQAVQHQLLHLQGRSHPCSRPCEPGRAMTCRFDFHVENYHSMSKACYGCPGNASDCARPDCIAADGVSRALVVVNRQMPGPSIQVCQGDRLEVTVYNRMPEQSTSVHWHGMQQRGTPYMDGVPFVTQCPVQPQSAFRYSFRADNAGTHFWHSHTGCQRADGALGMLTVRVPRAQDPHAALYDEDLPEHGILVWDWTHTPAASKFLAHHHAGDDNKADSVLINGKGVARRFEAGDGTAAVTPREVFAVKQGLRYRFRLVNAGFLNCPLELSVDNHTLLVVSSDGADVKPVRVDSLVSYAGERWDVIVEATQPVANYWVRVHGLLDCGPRRAHEAAVLRYVGADPAAEPAGPPPNYDVFLGTKGLQVNPLNRGSADPDTLTAAELQALPSAEAADDPALKPEADVQLFVSYDFYAVDNPHIHRAGLYGIAQVAQSPHRVFTPQLNHISLSLPPFPLLSGRDRLDLDADARGEPRLCNETSLLERGRDCTREYCECTHVVRVPLGGVLEIVLVDQGVRYDANHPFHLHGHAFRVVALERLGNSTTVSDVQRLDAAGGIPRNLRDPPTKDTVTVPDGGYTVLRVHADNPGYWLFHCHIEFHVELGMALVVKVGEHEDMPAVPRGFPQCGDWGSHNWLGGGDSADVSLDEVADDADLADTPVAGNHIARLLSAEGRPGAALPPRQAGSPTTTTATRPVTEPVTEESRTVPTEDDAVADSTTAAVAVDAQDVATELLTLVADQGGAPVGGKYRYTADGDGTTARPEESGEDDAVSETASTAADTSTAVPPAPADPSTPSVPSTPGVPPAAPGRAWPSALSQFIMRVASPSAPAGRRPPLAEAAGRERWVISDPARPDLQYNVLVEVPQERRRAAESAAVTADRAYAHAASISPTWVPLASTIVCLALAL